MFDLVPNLFSSVIAILFPIFASYKALRTSDPAQLTPWLMYWVVLSIALLAESWAYFILAWVPFYGWMRLFFLFYLVLPQTQGAKILYQEHVHPFLASHEAQIEEFISDAHDRAKAAGLQYLKQAIDYVKERVFGIPPEAEQAPSRQSYAQSLLSRFNLPTAQEGGSTPAGEFYGLLTSALSHAMGSATTREQQARNLNASGNLLPEGIASDAEKMDYLTTQRERLQVLLSALDKEANQLSETKNKPGEEENSETKLRTSSGEHHSKTSAQGNLTKNKSETEFESIGNDVDSARMGRVRSNGGWMPWNWNQNDVGQSSGVDPDPKL